MPRDLCGPESFRNHMLMWKSEKQISKFQYYVLNRVLIKDILITWAIIIESKYIKHSAWLIIFHFVPGPRRSSFSGGRIHTVWDTWISIVSDRFHAVKFSTKSVKYHYKGRCGAGDMNALAGRKFENDENCRQWFCV